MEQNKIDVLSKISTQMAAVLKKQDELANGVIDTNAGLDVIRANYTKERKFWNEGGPEPFKIIDDVMMTENGDVKLRFYYPDENPNVPVVIYAHGGGFVLGNLDTHDRIMRTLCVKSGFAVVGIDYHLSPEAKYPVALMECVKLVKHLREHAKEFGIDKSRISFAGDSGGANLCLASTLYIRDHEEDSSYIKSLLLYYGTFGLRDSVGIRTLGGPWDGLTKSDLDYYYSNYLGNHPNPDYFYLFDLDLSYGIPPTFIASAEYDPLIDDSVLLHKIMTEKKLENTYKEFKGVIHAFLHHSKMLDEAMEALNDGALYLKAHM